MKKLVLFIIVLTSCMSMTAQDVLKFRNTEAKTLGVSPESYVVPLVTELEIVKTIGRIDYVFYLTEEEVMVSMKGEVENVRSYAIYKASKEYGVDAIVAPSINIETLDNDAIDEKNKKAYKKGDFMVNIIGYPANFVNWRSINNTDETWINMKNKLTTRDVINHGAEGTVKGVK